GGAQRLERFALLRKLGEPRFLRRLVRRQRQMLGMQGLILLAKPFRFRFQAVPFGGRPAGLAELGLLISLRSGHPLIKRDKLSQELLAPCKHLLDGGGPRRRGCHGSTTAWNRCAGGSGLSRA